jgi:hypothetical protein
VPPIAGTIASEWLVLAQIALAVLANGRFGLLLAPHPASSSTTKAVVAADRAGDT